MKNRYTEIKKAMRRNEVELLAHLRKNRVGLTALLGRSWNNALDRLLQTKQVFYHDGRYHVIKGARPATPAIRS
jgi:hypothetical protein